jgi:hypothetical protein
MFAWELFTLNKKETEGDGGFIISGWNAIILSVCSFAAISLSAFCNKFVVEGA